MSHRTHSILVSTALLALCSGFAMAQDTSAAAVNFADNSQFVKRMYLGFLNRAADSDGLNYWTGSLNSGSASRDQVALAFFNSTEFQQYGAVVADAYIGVLGRDPDYGGFTSWMAQVQANGTNGCTVPYNATPLLCTQQNLIMAFMTSPEFIATYGALTDAQFVALVYQNVLGRPADPDGLTYWTNELDGGYSRVAMIQSFLNSAEFTALVNNRLLADMSYLGFLLRTRTRKAVCTGRARSTRV